MDETTQVVTLESLVVGDVLNDYGVKMMERGWAYTPNFTGTTDTKGNWVGEKPQELIRLRFEDIRTGNCAYLMPHIRTLIRCNAEWEVVSTEELPWEVTIPKRPKRCSSIPRVEFNGIKPLNN